MAAKRFSTLVALLLAALTLGCASLGTMTPPDVSLVDLEFQDLTVFETSGEITVRLTNENPEPLVVSGAVYKLYLNGIAVGKGLDPDGIEMPRLGSVTKTVSVHINNVALVARLATLLEEPTLSYRIRSKLWVDRPYGTRKVKLDHQGRFEFGRDRDAIELVEPAAPGGGK